MADENHSPLGRRELNGILADLGEKAENTPKEKDQILEEVQESYQRKNRNLLITLIIGLTILGVLFALAVRKYYSQF